MSKHIKIAAKTKVVGSVLDYSLWALLLVLSLGFIAVSQYYKVDGVAIKLACSILAFSVLLVVYSYTNLGQETLGFAKLSRIEFLKIVWPSQQEASRMTMLVVFAVAMLALLLWMLDAVLFWLIRLVTG